MIATIHLLGLAVFIAIGFVWAIVRDVRALAAERREAMARRRALRDELASRGYNVVAKATRYGTLLVDDEWNRLLSQFEFDPHVAGDEIRAARAQRS